MLNQIVLNVMVRGITVKLNRGENLEEILVSYVSLNEDEKQQIREKLNANEY